MNQAITAEKLAFRYGPRTFFAHASVPAKNNFVHTIRTAGRAAGHNFPANDAAVWKKQTYGSLKFTGHDVSLTPQARFHILSDPSRKFAAHRLVR